ncbi:MAG: nuclear transport factor 2 family protein [Xanthobacteraceae bacterium]
MTEQEAQDFVDRFAAAWSARDGNAFLALWHPDGKLHYPFANRAVKGSEIGMLNDLQTANAPHLTWTLVSWWSLGNVLVIEWECSNRYGERILRWRGVDKLTLVDGRIVEEIVYADTAPLQALRQGRAFDALIQLPA